MRKETIGPCDLYLGDAANILHYHLQRDGSYEPIDHLIMDPPYDEEAHKQYRPRRNKRGGAGDRQQLDFASLDETMRRKTCAAAKRMVQGWLIAFCQTEQVSFWRDDIESEGLKYKSPMVWVKPDATPKMNGQGPAIGYESMVTAWCGSGYAKWNAGGKRGVYTHLTNSATRGDYNVRDAKDQPVKHATEKPLLLMRELITDFTEHGQLILDPFAGSGTTGVAAVQLGRRCILIEQNPLYFEMCCQRVTNALKQVDMFIPPVKLNQDDMGFARERVKRPEGSPA